MSILDILKSLIPIRIGGNRWAKGLEADAGSLSDLDADLQTLEAELNPETATASIGDWERAFGLSSDGLSLEQRRARVVQKRGSLGELNDAYFISTAAKLGYTVTITKAPSPFRLGISKLPGKVYDRGSKWVWKMNILEVAIDAVPLDTFEAVISDLIPPFSRVDFVL